MGDETIVFTESDKYEILSLANVWRGARGGYCTPRLYSDKNIENKIGAAGEWAFYLLYRHLGCAPPDRTPRPAGDRGIDFFTPWGTLDVKTSRKKGNLLVKQNDVSRLADVLVQAHLTEDDSTVRFLGWYLGADFQRDVKGQEPKNLKGLICNFIPDSRLEPMYLMSASFDYCVALSAPWPGASDE